MTERMESLRRDLREVRERLLSEMAGVGEEQFKRRPQNIPDGPAAPEAERQLPGGWCIAEVLAHLLASHRHEAGSIRAQIEGTQPPPADSEGLQAAARAGRAAPVPQLIHGLLAAFRELDGLMTQLESGPAGGAAAQEPFGSGPEITTLLRRNVIEAEAEHTRRIAAIKAELGAGRSAGA